MYSEDFNPNQLKYLTYAQDVDKIELPGLLMELSQLYFQQLGEKRHKVSDAPIPAKKSTISIDINVYQCSLCSTVYDSRYGDTNNVIAVGVPFEQLPEGYCCSVCEADRRSFEKITVDILNPSIKE